MHNFILMAFLSIVILIIPLIAILHTRVEGDTKDIGVCYGFNGDNLPSPSAVVNLYKQSGIGKMRIFEPNHSMLDALKESDIDLVLGVRNQDIPVLAASQDAAETWFAANVQPYVDSINMPYISIGNEVVPGEFSDSILPAMQNLQNVLKNHGLEGMRVTTVVHMDILASTYPPSETTFSDQALVYMSPIVKQLSAEGAPLLINVYPYFAYASDPSQVRLDYAQFTAVGTPVVQDGNLAYMNMFDAMVDSFFWAMEKVGVTDVDIVVSETGWPHDGNGNLTSVELAKTYNQNFMQHILSNVGTPKKPGAYIEGFIFAMLDENLKPAGVEQKFGMFQPTLEPNYNIFS